MAASRATFVAGLCHNFTKNLAVCNRHGVQRRCCSTLTSIVANHDAHQTRLLPVNRVDIVPQRNVSWYNTLTADRLWKSMTALTGKAQTKARGKKPQKRVKKDLNKGRNIGEGRAGLVWSGLNAKGTPQFTDDIVARPQQLDPEREKFLADMRFQQGRQKRKKLVGEEKGWTSAGWGGRSLGPPDPIPGENFQGFQSKVMFVKRVFNMTGTMGRKRSMLAMVIVGNGKGAIGYGLGKGSDAMSALRKAKNKAGIQLQYIERYDNHTILHDVEYKFIATRVRMRKMTRGSGLKCHRVIQEICQLAGITDMHAKVHGSSNALNLVQCVFKGLASQETYDNIANRTGMNVVEFRPECGPLPIVLASPDHDKVLEDDSIDEVEWDKEIPLEKKEVTKTKRGPFYRPGKLISNEFSASSNPHPEVYTSQEHVS